MSKQLYIRPPANCGNQQLGLPAGLDPIFTHPSFETLVMDNSVSGRREGVIDKECYTSIWQWNPQWQWPEMLSQGVNTCKYVLRLEQHLWQQRPVVGLQTFDSTLKMPTGRTASAMGRPTAQSCRTSSTTSAPRWP